MMLRNLIIGFSTKQRRLALLIVLVLPLFLILFSCSHKMYYKKVRKNIVDFKTIVERLQTEGDFQSMDSIVLKDGLVINSHHKCLYYTDSIDIKVAQFMHKYDLKKICVTERSDEYFNHMISFHKEFNPFFGKADVVYFDYGSSEFRNMVSEGIARKDERVKIINDYFIYSLRLKPAFGE